MNNSHNDFTCISGKYLTALSDKKKTNQIMCIHELIIWFLICYLTNIFYTWININFDLTINLKCFISWKGQLKAEHIKKAKANIFPDFMVSGILQRMLYLERTRPRYAKYGSNNKERELSVDCITVIWLWLR